MPSSALATLEDAAAQVLATRAMGRVLLLAPEGHGRTHLLQELGFALGQRGTQSLLVSCRGGSPASRLLRELVTLPREGRMLDALLTSPALAALEPDRRPLAAELLASLLGEGDLPLTGTLDVEGRREGAFVELVRLLVERASGARVDAHAGAVELTQNVELAPAPSPPRRPFASSSSGVLSFVTSHAPRAPTGGGALVVAFDDAHLADEDGLALLDFLAERSESTPLLVIASVDSTRAVSSAISERVNAWRARTDWRTVRLSPMDPTALEKLVVAAGVDAPRAAAIARRAAGNPSLALGVAAIARTQPALTADALPGTPEALRVEAVRAFGADAFELAQLLAVVGGRAPVGAIAAVTRASSVAADELTQRLVFAGVLARRGDVLTFADERTAAALVQAGAPPGWKLQAGEWAVRQLESDGRFEAQGDLLVPLALPLLDPVTASLWHEALALRRTTRAAKREALIIAGKDATGVRRLVLYRQLAEAQLFAGQPEAALATLQQVGRGVPARSTFPGGRVGQQLAARRRGVLDRWEALSPEEAAVAIELVRGECLSHLVKKDETVRVFAEAERRLSQLHGPVAQHLWVRWALGQCWFLCEILGRAAQAMQVCEQVRRRVPAEVLGADEQASAFVRAEEIATSSVGDFARARGLIDELEQLAQQAGNLRELCLAWNARAILHFGHGELAAARSAFERSRDLARSTGWVRREAIALHNLALVLTELGELDAAFGAEAQYARLSVGIGNHAAKAEAPAVQAAVMLAKPDLAQAEALVQSARREAEVNGWSMLVAWTRILSGRLRFQRALSGGDLIELPRAKNEFLAAIEVLEETSTAWTEEIDPGEVYALHAALLARTGQAAQARELLSRAERLIPKQNVVSQRALALGRAVVERKGFAEALAWFAERGYARRVATWQQLAP